MGGGKMIRGKAAAVPSVLAVLALVLGSNGALAGLSGTFSLTVLDDDPIPSVSFSVATQSVNEGNSGTSTATVNVTLSMTSGKVVSVPYTVGGTAIRPTDHDAVSSTLTIAPGQAGATITFAIVGDTVIETNETVYFVIGTPTNASGGAPAAHTVTIVNDDGGTDSTPDQFYFVDEPEAVPQTYAYSNTITITGTDALADVTVSGGQYSRNGSSWTTSATTAVPGDTFAVRHLQGGCYKPTQMHTRLTVGGIFDTFTSTCFE